MFSILAFPLAYSPIIKLAFYNNILIILMNVENQQGLPLATNDSSKNRSKFLFICRKSMNE